MRWTSRGLVVVRVDEDEVARLGLADADVEAVVLLLVDEHIGRRRRADDGGGRRSSGRWLVVEPDVEQRAAVGRPDDGAARVGHGVAQVLAGARDRGCVMVKSSEPLSSTA